MADEADIANDVAQRALDLALERAQANRHELPLTGCCHNCGDLVGPEARFCDTDCRDDHGMLIAAKRRNGRV